MKKTRVRSQRGPGERDGHDPLVFLLVFVAAGLMLVGLGSDSIRSTHEGYYAEGAREMVESGEWVTPHFNYEPRFQKPPLTYWLIAASYRAFGVTEAAARLPSAVLAALSLAVIYGIGKALFEKRVALLGALALGTGLGHFHTAQSATPGIVFSFFIWLSLLGFVKAYVGERASLFWLVVAYASAGLAALGKGPGGILLPGLAGLLFLLVNRDLRALKRLGLWWGLPLAVLIPAAWYLTIYQRHGFEAIQVLLVEQNLQRFTSFELKGGVLYYPTRWPIEFFPWAVLLVPAAAQGLLRRGEGRRGARFCWVALVAWLVFFSAARDKEGYYIMLLHLPAALLVADMFAGLADGSVRGGWLVRGLAGLLAVSSMLVLAGAVAFVLIELAPATQWQSGFWAGPAVLAALVWIGVRRVWPETPKLLPMLACMMLGFEVFMGAHVWPRLEAVRPYRAIGEVIERERPVRVGAYNLGGKIIVLRKTSLPFYARRRVEPLEGPAQLRSFLASGARVCVVMDERDYDAVGESLPGGRRLGRWRYLRGPDTRAYSALHAIRPGEEADYVVVVGKR